MCVCRIVFPFKILVRTTVYFLICHWAYGFCGQKYSNVPKSGRSGVDVMLQNRHSSVRLWHSINPLYFSACFQLQHMNWDISVFEMHEVDGRLPCFILGNFLPISYWSLFVTMLSNFTGYTASNKKCYDIKKDMKAFGVYCQVLCPILLAEIRESPIDIRNRLLLFSVCWDGEVSVI
jgi:hypothetical protein